MAKEEARTPSGSKINKHFWERLVLSEKWVAVAAAMVQRGYVLWVVLHFGAVLAFATPPLLPVHFSIAFRSGSMNNTQRIVPGVLYYDSERQMQAMYHSAAAYECERFYNTSGVCINIFDHRGTWAVIPTERRCWLDVPGVGYLPRNWLEKIPFVANLTLPECGRVSQYNAHPPIYFALQNGIPCKVLFVMPPQESGSQLDFDIRSLSYSRPDKKVFELAPYCKEP